MKQGDSLSPVIFLLFINDLAQELAGMNVGTLFDQRKIPILMYADDIVLLSDSEKEMQTMLDHVHKWCKKWLMAVNLDKTKIVHFRKAKTPRSEYIYKYGSQPVEYANVYKYLGMYFDEHLTFEHNEEQLTLAGNRALGGIISKLKQNDCMSYEVYTKCVFTCVKPVIEYGSEIVGVYNHGKLERVINAAARAFLGVHKFCPISAMYKDLGWMQYSTLKLINVLRYWNKLIKMKHDRLTKAVFDYMYDNQSIGSWCYYVKEMFRKMDKLTVFQNKVECDIQEIKGKVHQMQTDNLDREITKKPKLRLFKQLVKDERNPQVYVKLNINASERSLLSQLRMGILPIRLETGRFNNLKIDDRVCMICNNGEIEDEIHFLFSCNKYEDIRAKFISDICRKNPELNNIDKVELLSICFRQHTRQLAKYVYNIFEKRKELAYNTNV